jgi:hypothetical protein
MIGEKYFLLRNNYDLVRHIIDDPLNSKYQAPINFLLDHCDLFVKTHPNTFVQMIPDWKNQVTCVFPVEYTWIPQVLLYGKHYFYNQPDEYRRSLTLYRVNRFLKDTVLVNSWTELHQKTQGLFDPHCLNFYNNSYKIDMYNLVFNDNIDQIYQIKPNFQFTKEKQNMLSRVKNSSIEIMTKLNLDPDYTVDVNDRPHDFINRYNLSTAPN